MSQYYMGVCFSISSLIFSITLLYLFLKRKKDLKLEIENKIFLGLIIFAIVLAVFEFIKIYSISKSSIDSPPNTFIVKTDVFLTMIWEFVFVIYLSIISNKTRYSGKNNIHLKKLFIILGTIGFLLSLVLCIISEVEYFGIEEGEEVAYAIGGPLLIALYLVTIVVFGYAIFITTKNKNNIRNIFVTPLYIDFITLIAIIILKFIYPNLIINILITFFVLTIAIAFLTTESQDNRLLYEYTKTKSDANKAIKAQNEFLINMSHEIRTPMNTIIGFSESLLNANNYTYEGIVNDLKNIKEANNTLNDHIHNLLDISRLESNKEKLKNDNYYLEEILCDINEYALNKLGNKEVKFSIELSPNIPSGYYGDSKKLNKIITYTIENAIEYTNYGEVKLKVDGRNISSNVIELTFLVSNSGHAMTNESFMKEFEDYVNIDNASQNNKGTIKLGLIIAKRLIKMMGGKIEFLNAKDKGTNYYIRVRQRITIPTPIGDISNKLNETSKKQVEYKDFSNRKILLVDDEEINIRLISKILKPYNFNLITAGSGQKAYELFKENKFDLVLLDSNMPDMNGKQTLKEFYSTGYEIPPIILIVSNENEFISTNYQNEGFNGCLLKPIDTYQLDKYLNDFLQEVNK